jgi:hypothetical protein
MYVFTALAYPRMYVRPYVHPLRRGSGQRRYSKPIRIALYIWVPLTSYARISVFSLVVHGKGSNSLWHTLGPCGPYGLWVMSAMSIGNSHAVWSISFYLEGVLCSCCSSTFSTSISCGVSSAAGVLGAWALVPDLSSTILPVMWEIY